MNMNQHQQQQQPKARKVASVSRISNWRVQVLVVVVVVVAMAGQQQVSCDDVTAPFFSYAISPFNRLLPNTVKGISSDVNSAQESVMAALSGANMEAVNEMMKSLQGATSNRYQAMDKMFIRFIGELARPEVMCRQYLAETNNAIKLVDAEAASLLAQATSGANQVSQGASSFMNKFG